MPLEDSEARQGAGVILDSDEQDTVLRSSGRLEEALSKFSLQQLQLIYENVSVIELTEGCSNACDFCGVDSLNGVRDYIAFSTLEKFVKVLSEARERMFEHPSMVGDIFDQTRLRSGVLLYFRSDPLDYNFNGQHYFDVVNLFNENGINVIETITAIPKGQEEFAIQHLDQIDTISISHMNRERLAPHFDDLGIVTWIIKLEYDSGHYNIEYYRLDGDQEKLNRFLDNKEGSHISLEDIPFIDYRTLQGRNGSNRDKPQYYLACTGHEEGKVSDIDYLDIRSKTDNSCRGVCRSGRLYNGSHDGRWGISFQRGVLVSPEGIFNMRPIEISAEHQTGIVIEPIDPEDFKVVKREGESEIHLDRNTPLYRPVKYTHTSRAPWYSQKL